MTQKISRRAFLKGSLTAAGSVAASTTLAKKAAALTKAKQEPMATPIDISKCIGCEACVYACQDSNGHKFADPKKPFPKMYPQTVHVEDWSAQTEVTDRLTPYNWLYIQHATVTINGEATELTLPRRCMHCENPPCVKLCPWGSAKQEDNGLYLDLLPALAGNGVMYKCDRCYDKLKKGELPACIEACPQGVQTIGPRTEILETAHGLAKEMNGYIYGEHENGGNPYHLCVSCPV